MAKHAQIVSRDGYKYQITATDVLWGARMVWGETGDNYRDAAGVLWALSNRMVYLGIGTRNPMIGRGEYAKPGRTFSDLAIAFSEPINPYHASHGNIERKRRAKTISLAEIATEKPQAWRAIVEWSKGTLPNPFPSGGYVNWAMPAVVARNPDAWYGNMTLGTQNVYVKERSTRNWARDYVQFRPGKPWYSTPLGASGIGVAVAVAGMYAFATWDR